MLFSCLLIIVPIVCAICVMILNDLDKVDVHRTV